MKKMGLLALLGISCLLSCSKSNTVANIDCSTSKSFATDVLPVVQSSCSYNASCHATGSTKGPGALVSYTQIYSARTSIRSAVTSGSMPENGSLTTAEMSAIVCWIDAGASDN